MRVPCLPAGRGSYHGNMQKRLVCIVHGAVQGVSFRDFTRATAQEHGLLGFVRNLSNGTVEVVAEGEEAALHELLRELREKHPFARVERIDAGWGEPTGEFPDFRILYS